MQIPFRQIVQKAVLPIGALFFGLSGFGQTTAIDKNPQAILKHGIEQYQGGQYNLATNTLSSFLDYGRNTANQKAVSIPSADKEQALFYKTLAGVRLRDQDLVNDAVEYVQTSVNKHNQERVAYELAKYYLEDNRDMAKAIYYYEFAGVDNLSNAEIADAKFQLGYAYFISQNFEKARNLFVGIKDIESNKYYLPANYYYGLLSYQEGRLDDALRSFKIVRNVPEYKDIIPYYEAEIYYFKGDYDKVLDYSRKYLKKKGELYYDKEMRLLTGQTLFEQKKYGDALPYFEEYYDNSDKIRKEELYELAYTYFQLGRYEDAIAKFQPLSNIQDTLGQTSMYLLGDCYLKTNDKKGARSAFGLASEMNYSLKQKEAASFLYNKLSYELGYDQIATQGFKSYIQDYPNSVNTKEAKTLLSSLLVKSNNYPEAFDLLSNEPNKDATAWETLQKAAVGRALQLMQDKQYAAADRYLDASLENPINPSLEALAYFWKGESDYQQGKYSNAVKDAKTFLEKSKGYEEAIKKISAKATAQNANLNIGYASLKTDEFTNANTAFADAQKGSSTSTDISKDAVIRQADAAFMAKDFDNAAKLYDKAIASNAGDVDYARFQKALILGLQNKSNEKIELLKYIVKNGEAKNKEMASFELANELINADKNTDAILLLKDLDNNKTSIATRTRAAYLLAYAYQDNHQNELAIKAYENYITEYPAGTDRKAALDALKNLYAAEPDKFVQFLQKENITEVSATEVESSYYDAADDDFAAGNYDKAAAALQKYLDKYPNGIYFVQAKYYLGESNYKMGKMPAAKLAFEQVLNQKWNDFSEDAALRLGQISLDAKRYTDAKAYYNQILENGGDDNAADTYEGMMKVAYGEKDYEAVQTWADMLLSVGDASDGAKLNARLYKAKSLQSTGMLEDAKAIYQELDKQNVGNTSAEARYEIANILFAQKKNEAAEKAASYAAQASNNNPYWAVKNYILLADILADNKDYFNAKATLQSVIKNAKDESLIQEAKQKLAAVKAKEAGKSKLSE